MSTTYLELQRRDWSTPYAYRILARLRAPEGVELPCATAFDWFDDDDVRVISALNLEYDTAENAQKAAEIAYLGPDQNGVYATWRIVKTPTRKD